MFSIFKRKTAGPSAELGPEANTFLATATGEFNGKQSALASHCNFNSYARWDFDQYSGVLALTLADGSRVLADGQILGSHCASDGTWEWAWNNPHVEAGVALASGRVKDLGARLGIAYLVNGKIPVPNALFVSYLCALGVKATDSDGVFPGGAGPIMVYVLVTKLRRA